VENAKGELRLRIGLPASCRFVLFFAHDSGKRDRHQAEEGRRERDMPRDARRDGKHLKIVLKED
jgi:hypothetical protein